MKKLILFILFLLFVLNAGSAYSFNYKDAKCALVPLSHSLKLKMSAVVYSFFRKNFPIKGKIFTNYHITNNLKGYSVVIKSNEHWINPYMRTHELRIFILKDGKLIGTYVAGYTRGLKNTPGVYFNPSNSLCRQLEVKSKTTGFKRFPHYIRIDYEWNYYPILPAVVETAPNRFVYNHIVSEAELRRIEK